MNQQFQTAEARTGDGTASAADARACMLTEIAFKWLMAGQGCWVDSARLHGDPAYVKSLLLLALASQSPELRECAMVLQAQVVAPAS